jgi:dipeptidase D
MFLHHFNKLRSHSISLTTVLTTVLFTLLFISNSLYAKVSNVATEAADFAVKTYPEDMIESLRSLVKYNTVAKAGVPSTDNPIHQAFKKDLARQAELLGLDYTDHGYVVVIGLGDNEQRFGLITHGDVQPANPKKWVKSPFELDTTSEPGKLIGRGTEDDKAPIVNVLYAMKTIKQLNIPLKKRIELYVYMAEESDWQPLKEFIKQHSLPQMNITLDAEYPAVVAEKGYGSLSMVFPDQPLTTKQSYVSEFSGGFFGSQIPEDAQVIIENVTEKMFASIKMRATAHDKIKYDFFLHNNRLTIKALGKSAHSSKPEDGVNAISHLSQLLAFQRWPNNASGALVNFINDNLGLSLYGEKFGHVAYSDSFMGAMTMQATVLTPLDNGIKLNINTRRPRGKGAQQLTDEITTVMNDWQQANQFTLQEISADVGQPFVQTKAPQISTLLNVFSHYTGMVDAKPVSIGGGTNSRLFPTAVSFGPSMPGKEYSGHSEHEFISYEQFLLNLKMYTAVLIELTKA